MKFLFPKIIRRSGIPKLDKTLGEKILNIWGIFYQKCFITPINNNIFTFWRFFCKERNNWFHKISIIHDFDCIKIAKMWISVVL